MGSSIERCTVIRTDGMDPEAATIRYRKTADGWSVQTPKDANFRAFALSEASERDVKQLISKKWDARYGDPDPFEREVEINTTQTTLDDGGDREADDG